MSLNEMPVHLICILLLSNKKYSSVSEQFCLSAKIIQNQYAPEKALKFLDLMAVEDLWAFLNHSLSRPKKASSQSENEAIKLIWSMVDKSENGCEKDTQ